MLGGWGAHLGHLLRNASSELWLVQDTGNNVNVNAGLNYYRQVNKAWVLVGTQTFPTGRVQQNAGSVIHGNMLYTYGLDVDNQKIVECYFDTANATYSYHACNWLPFTTGTPSNYIGATISKDGVRVVWWTTTNGTFSYTYNYGGGWNGPVTSTLNGYPAFAYVYARLADDNSHIDFLGAAPHATGGSSVGYDALYGSTTLGNAVSNWTLLYANGMGLETWIDRHGGLHAFTYGSATPLYFYKEAGGSITGQPALPDSGITGARIVETATHVYLVMAFADGSLKYKTIKQTDINGPILWSSLPNRTIGVPVGLGYLTLYPESSMYQSNAPSGLNFMVNGYEQQDRMYFIEGH